MALHHCLPAPRDQAPTGNRKVPLRILLHDYGAYGFIVQLARWLAAHGHMVLHLRSGDLVGPQGPAQRQPEDPPGLCFDALSIGRPFCRYALHRRVPDEIRYGRRLGDVIAKWRPDVVLSANTPPFAQAMALRAARRHGVPFVNWVQDIFSEGAGTLAARLPRPLGALALALLRRVEYGALRAADGVAVISPEFRELLRLNAINPPGLLLQENWAPPVPARPVDAGWAAARGLGGRRLLLAAGTLGLKHDPGMLAELAMAMANDPAVRVVVVSQGPGRDHLSAWLRGRDVPLVLLDYQPAADVPAMLASAEIGLVLLTAAAGGMSVPSKVYTYAAAGLPILAAVPPGNHVAGLIREQGLGLVVAPDDRAGFVTAARRLLADADLRGRCAAAGRAFSARHGDMDAIGGRFERLLTDAVAARPPAPRRLPGLPPGAESAYLCALALSARAPASAGGSGLDRGALLSLARSQGMLPLLTRALPAQEAPADDGMAREQARRILALSAVLLELLAALEARSIKTLALKGPVLSLLLHGEIGSRPCGDIDLLIDPGQAAAAAAVLAERGFVPLLDIAIDKLVMVSKDCPYRRGDLFVELHWRLFDNPHLLGWTFENLWQERMTIPLGGRAVPTLSVRHYGVYLAVHGIRHGWQRLRWLVDMGVLLGDPARSRTIREQASRDGLEPALTHAALLARDLLGLSLPEQEGWRVGWRVRAIDRSVENLSTILARRQTDRTGWLRRRLAEKWLDLLLCTGPRAFAMEVGNLLVRPGELVDLDLPLSLFWLYPLARPFLLARRIWRRAWGQRAS